MRIRFSLLVFLVGGLASVSSSRTKRFLNAKVHNRIDVLDKSHIDHQQQTSFLRNVVFGSTIILSILFLLSIIGLVYLCIRFRNHRRPNLLSMLSPSTTNTSPSPLDMSTIQNLLRMMSHFSISTPSSNYPASHTTHEPSADGTCSFSRLCSNFNFFSVSRTNRRILYFRSTFTRVFQFFFSIGDLLDVCGHTFRW